MALNPLTAQDAVSPSVLNVSAEMHLRALSPQTRLQKYEAYAVFSELADQAESRDFLGIVMHDTVSRYPYRIFADLLSFSTSLPVEPSAPLDALYSDFEQSRLDAFSVMESGQRFIGAITLPSLLKALWHREQFLTARLQQEISKTIFVERQLQQTKHDLVVHLDNEADCLDEYQRQVGTLSESLKSAEKRARQDLATELHDHLAQVLAVGRMKLAQGNHLSHNPELSSLLNTVNHLFHESLTYTRTLMTELSSNHLYREGLLETLKILQDKMKQFNLNVILEIEQPLPELTEDQLFHVYWSLRELLFHVIKHAHVEQTGIIIQKVHDTSLQFIVSDAGPGFEPDKRGRPFSPHEHFGLAGIQGRITSLQGTVTIHSSPGKGTQVILTLPLPPLSPSNGSSV